MGLPQRVAVWVPAKDEAATLPGILETIMVSMQSHSVQIVVIDDGSQDDTAEIAALYTKHVIRQGSPGVPMGNGVAARTALRYIKSEFASLNLDCVIRVDGDGQHKAERINEIIDCIQQGYDAVMMSRFHRLSDKSQVKLNRDMINRDAAGWVQDATGLQVTDARTGFHGYRYSVLEPIIDDLKTDGYGSPIETLIRVWEWGQRHHQPIRHIELPHPALYGKGMQAKLRSKWANETPEQQADRLKGAFLVYLRTCEELGIGREADLEIDEEYVDHPHPVPANESGTSAK